MSEIPRKAIHKLPEAEVALSQGRTGSQVCKQLEVTQRRNAFRIPGAHAPEPAVDLMGAAPLPFLARRLQTA